MHVHFRQTGWSEKWLMPINAARCVYMHFGETMVNKHGVGEVTVPVIRVHKDHGMTVSNDLTAF